MNLTHNGRSGGALRYLHNPQERDQLAWEHIHFGTSIKELSFRSMVNESQLYNWVRKLRRRLQEGPHPEYLSLEPPTRF